MPAPSRHRSRSGSRGGVDYADIQRLAKDFGGIPPYLRTRIRPELVKIGRKLATEAKRNAEWSSRIPGAIGVSVNTSMKSGGVRIVTKASKAPHARAYEGIATRKPVFRHPVFARGDNRSNWTWVTENTRPFLVPAVKSGQDDARRQIADVVQRAMNRVGA